MERITLKRWHCPNCDLKHVTQLADPNLPFHRCVGTHGLEVPYVEEGTRAKIVVVEREDYVGREMVQADNRGVPVMSVLTVRDEGMDTTVYAPCATATGH